MNFRIGQRPPAPADLGEAVELLAKSSTGTLGHLTDFGFVEGLQPISRPAHAIGPAYTIHLPQVDGVALHYALGDVEAGEVLVIDTSGERRRATWGGVVAHAAMRAGVKGVLVDGPITDWEEVMATGIPVWCRGTTSLTGRRLGFAGEVQVPVQVGGAVVNPGDIVFADSDGAFIIPADGAARLALQLIERDTREPVMKQRLDAGEKLPDISGAAEVMEQGARG